MSSKIAKMFVSLSAAVLLLATAFVLAKEVGMLAKSTNEASTLSALHSFATTIDGNQHLECPAHSREFTNRETSLVLESAVAGGLADYTSAEPGVDKWGTPIRFRWIRSGDVCEIQISSAGSDRKWGSSDDISVKNQINADIKQNEANQDRPKR